MTEMEQEQRVNLYTDEIIRKALDIKAAKAKLKKEKELEQFINQNK